MFSDTVAFCPKCHVRVAPYDRTKVETPAGVFHGKCHKQLQRDFAEGGEPPHLYLLPQPELEM